MKNIKFNDWQEMALKKDMETIIRKLNTQEPLIFSLCWEIVLAVGTIIVDHLVDTSEVSMCWWIAVILLAIVPPVVVLVCKLCKWLLTIGKVKTGIYDVKNMVDTFDNQICYWVMMCNSYCNLLSEENNSEAKKFLYQEGCYYNNKSIQELYHMKPVIDKVFSEQSDLITKNKYVAVYRLESLLELMKQYQQALDREVEALKNNYIIKEQMKINEEYKDRICQFIDDVNKVFDRDLEWIP